MFVLSHSKNYQLLKKTSCIFIDCLLLLFSLDFFLAGNVERGGEHIEQLSFDSLATVPSDTTETILWETPASIPAKASGALRRSAPSRRKAKKPSTLPEGMQQHTLDEFFATIPMEVDIPLSLPTKESRKNNDSLTQLSFETLATIPS